MILNDHEDVTFQSWQTRHRWFPVLREYEYGEGKEAGDETPGPEIPEALNWLSLLPAPLYFAFSDCECSLVYVRNDGTYGATVWDVTGEDDRPWAVFLVDDYGPRLLPEYSLLEEGADEDALNPFLQKAVDELPGRLEAGEFDRDGERVPVPDYLDVEPLDYEHQE